MNRAKAASKRRAKRVAAQREYRGRLARERDILLQAEREVTAAEVAREHLPAITDSWFYEALAPDSIHDASAAPFLADVEDTELRATTVARAAALSEAGLHPESRVVMLAAAGIALLAVQELADVLRAAYQERLSLADLRALAEERGLY